MCLYERGSDLDSKTLAKKQHFNQTQLWFEHVAICVNMRNDT